MRKPSLFAIGLAVLIFNGCASAPRTPAPVVREFVAHGISEVVLRASAADSAQASFAHMDAPYVIISGVPGGGAGGYHTSDPNWREKPAAERGLDFVARRHGTTLVICTKKEIHFLHHHYALERIHLMLPTSVRLVREVRRLTGDVGPDLSAP